MDENVNAVTPTAAGDTNPQESVLLDETDVAENTGVETQETQETQENNSATAQTGKQEEKGNTDPVVFKFAGGKTTNVDRSAAEAVMKALGDDADTFVATYQKGRNYEHAIERAVRESDYAKAFSKLTEETGMEEEDALRFVTETAVKLSTLNQIAAFKKQHPDWDDEKASLAAEAQLARAKADRAARSKEADEKKSAEVKERSDAFKSLIDEMVAAYPETYKDGDLNISDEEAQLIRDGIRPIKAHEIYLSGKKRDDEIAQLRASIDKMEKKKENKEASPGSLSQSEGEDADPFIAGLSYGR